MSAAATSSESILSQAGTPQTQVTLAGKVIVSTYSKLCETR